MPHRYLFCFSCLLEGDDHEVEVGRALTDDSVVCRIKVFTERFKIVLDCFFAIWFVVGNVWVLGGTHQQTMLQICTGADLFTMKFLMLHFLYVDM